MYFEGSGCSVNLLQFYKTLGCFNCVHIKWASCIELVYDHHQRFFIREIIKFLLFPGPT
jgi:hypothetical protein